MRRVFGLDDFITPIILTAVYYLCLVGIVIGTVSGMLGELGWFAILVGVGSFLIIRISLELIMVSFQNNEYLRKIAYNTVRNERKE